MANVLITGCAGFIGSHLTRSLLEEGHTVIGIDNFDSFYPREVKEKNMMPFKDNPAFIFLEKDITEGLTDIPNTDIDIIVHLAAKAGVRPSIRNPNDYIKTNITGTQKIHEFIRDRGIKKFIFASSSSVYGNTTIIPFNENDPVNKPISPYAYSKKAGEEMNYTLHHLYKVDVINLRFFTVYGPGQRPDLAIHKFIEQVYNNEPLSIFGTGDTARDYTFIDDIIIGIKSAIQYCLAGNNIYEIINLGNNKPVKLNDLTEIIYRLLKKEKQVIYTSIQPGDVDSTYADITKAGKLLRYFPKTDIESGVQQFIKWYLAQRPR